MRSRDRCYAGLGSRGLRSLSPRSTGRGVAKHPHRHAARRWTKWDAVALRPGRQSLRDTSDALARLRNHVQSGAGPASAGSPSTGPAAASALPPTPPGTAPAGLRVLRACSALPVFEGSRAACSDVAFRALRGVNDSDGRHGAVSRRFVRWRSTLRFCGSRGCSDSRMRCSRRYREVRVLDISETTCWNERSCPIASSPDSVSRPPVSGTSA